MFMQFYGKRRLITVLASAAFTLLAGAGSAQDRGDNQNRNDNNRNQGQNDNNSQGRNDNNGRDQNRNDRNGNNARGQGQNDRQGGHDYHFREEDRNQFSGHYRSNIRQFEQHPDRRHQIRAGEHLPSDYRSRLKPVPESYYRGVPPSPPGYRFGYYDGYVVAYDPTTQIVADVLDLVNTAVKH
jgi:Ni/Co efflux regulator RcnB